MSSRLAGWLAAILWSTDSPPAHQRLIWMQLLSFQFFVMLASRTLFLLSWISCVVRFTDCEIRVCFEAVSRRTKRLLGCFLLWKEFTSSDFVWDTICVCRALFGTSALMFF